MIKKVVKTATIFTVLLSINKTCPMHTSHSLCSSQAIETSLEQCALDYEKVFKRLNEKLTTLSTDNESSPKELEEAFTALSSETDDYLDEALIDDDNNRITCCLELLEKIKKQYQRLKSFDYKILFEHRKFNDLFCQLSINKKKSPETIISELLSLNATILVSLKKVHEKAPLRVPLFLDLQEKVFKTLETKLPEMPPKKPFSISLGAKVLEINPATINLEDVD